MRTKLRSSINRSLAVATVAGLAVIAHAGSASAQDFAFQAVVNPYYATWPQAAADASKDFSINVEVGSPQDFDQVQQDAVVNSFIAKGVKGIGIQPVDAVAGAETVKRVVATGVPVVGVAACAELEGTGAVMCINNALGESAYEATKLVCTTIGGKGNIVHLDGSSPTRTQRLGPPVSTKRWRRCPTASSCSGLRTSTRRKRRGMP